MDIGDVPYIYVVERSRPETLKAALAAANFFTTIEGAV